MSNIGRSAVDNLTGKRFRIVAEETRLGEKFYVDGAGWAYPDFTVTIDRETE